MQKRKLGTDRRGPPPNAVSSHADVVELWWAQSECRIDFGTLLALIHSPIQFLARQRINVL